MPEQPLPESPMTEEQLLRHYDAEDWKPAAKKVLIRVAREKGLIADPMTQVAERLDVKPSVATALTKSKPRYKEPVARAERQNLAIDLIIEAGRQSATVLADAVVRPRRLPDDLREKLLDARDAINTFLDECGVA